MEDRPWRKPGADLTDYFNYGFNEDTWNAYCERHRKYRAEFSAGNAEATRGILGNINLLNPLRSLAGVGRPMSTTHTPTVIVAAAISTSAGGGVGGSGGGVDGGVPAIPATDVSANTHARKMPSAGASGKIVVDLTQPLLMGTQQGAADPTPIMITRITTTGMMTHQSQQQHAAGATTLESGPPSPIETTHRHSIDESASAGGETPTQGLGDQLTAQQQAIMQMIKQEPGTQGTLLGPPSMLPSGMDFTRPPPILSAPNSGPGGLLTPGTAQSMRASSSGGGGFNPTQAPLMGVAGMSLASMMGLGAMGGRPMAPPGTQEERPPGIDDEGPPGADSTHSGFPGQLQVSGFGQPVMAGRGGFSGGGGPRVPGSRRLGGPGGGGCYHLGYDISPPRDSHRSRSRSSPAESSSRRRKERASKRKRDDSCERGVARGVGTSGKAAAVWREERRRTPEKLG